MLSLIEVQCPRCGARGQIMVPPIGSIIITPCPQCKELLVVFCGQVLPLDKEIMEGDSTDDRQEHLMDVLTEFLRGQIKDLLSGNQPPGVFQQNPATLIVLGVQCPHCGTQDHILAPPIGAIILGSCFQCKGAIVIYCGQVLPLDKEIMEGDSTNERQEHFLDVLGDFLYGQVEKLLGDDKDSEEEGFDQDFGRFVTGSEESDWGVIPPSEQEPETQPSSTGFATRGSPILQIEFERFIDVDLKLLDNKAYFKSVFEEKHDASVARNMSGDGEVIRQESQISEAEFKQFVGVDLKSLDDKRYFMAVFGHPGNS